MPRERAEHQLGMMVASMRHESFYKTGTWVDEAMGAYVGWTARERSFADPMPVRNERNDVALIFAGEEFCEPGTPRRLREKGHAVEDSGPGYLVHLYEEDPEFPKGLNGRFHGIVADRMRGTLKLFNDRYGMYRIYYYESRDAFYFAAEAKAILTVCPEVRRLNEQGLGEFVSCGCVLENRTVFEGIQVLPPASAWQFRAASIERRDVYFEPREWEEQTVLDTESYYQGLRDVFSRNLPRYMNGGGLGPMAVSLTGGLDTRMIMAWDKSAPGTLPCYSFGGSYRECQDVTLAREVATALEQKHEVIPVGQEFLAKLPHYAERTVYLADGCTDVGRSADLYVNEKARQISPLRMTGNYGGEVTRRVRAFKPVEPAAGLFQPEFLKHVHATRESYGRAVSGHPLSFAVFRQAPWHHYGLYAVEESQLAVRSPFLDNDFVKMVYRAPGSAALDYNVCLRLIREGNPDLMRIRTDRRVIESRGRLADALTWAWLEFTFKAEYAYDHGMPQRVAKVDHAFQPLHLERLFLGRHKFYHFRVWYRDAVASYLKETLLDSRALSRPYIRRATLEKMVLGHLKGDQNYTMEIHKVLTLELLHRLFLDASPAGLQARAEEVGAMGR